MNITGITPNQKSPGRLMNSIQKRIKATARSIKRPINLAMTNMPGTTQTIF
jgi:hypothetical protein